jgi:hypothetical protein
MSRVTIYCLVEGFSEANLVKRILAPHLAQREIDILAPMVTTRRDRKAGQVFKGGGAFRHYRGDLERLIRQHGNRPNIWFTTLIDLYALPGDFPAYQDGTNIQECRKRVAFFEAALGKLVTDLGSQRFIPYIQLHEFETLLLVNVEAMGTLFLNDARELSQLAAEVAGFDDVEEINHTPTGAPSKRIAKYISVYEKYKRSDQSGAINVLEIVGLEHLRAACRHFNEWVTALEGLTASPAAGEVAK